MATRARPQASLEVREQFIDFSLGVVNGISDAGKRIRHLRRANNVEFDPIGALSCRLGYRDIVDFVLPEAGHSLMEYYNAAGNELFVAAADKIYLVSDSSGYVEQTLPITATGAKWSHCNINGVLVACQEDGSNPPIAYNGTEWLSISFPTPGSGGTGALAAGGSVDTGAHSYRIRWLFRNGASLVSSLTGGTTTTTPGNNTVNITGIPISSRSDYLGFQVERTKVGDSTLWFFVGTGASAAATTYSDTASDASLGVLIPPQPGPYGQAPSTGGKYFAGITTFNNLLMGWIGSNLHVSRPIADAENIGVGVFNFNVLEVIPVRADDGARITATCIQVDRLVIGKFATSVHAVHASGADFKSLSLVSLYDGAGPVSTRGMCSHGPNVYWYGGGNSFYRMIGNDTRLWARRWIGEYLSEISPSREADIVLRNVEGKRIMMAYAATPSTFNEDAVVFRLDEGVWTHYRDMRIADILVRKEATEFAGARVVFADPKIAPASSALVFAGYSSHVCWLDARVAINQIYAQRVSPLGVAQWAANGVVVTGTAADQAGVAVLASDGNAGGLFSLSQMGQATSTPEIWAQKFNASGVAQWAGMGTQLSPVGNSAVNPTTFSTGDGSMFCGWRNNSISGRYYLNRLDAAGARLWGAGGVNVGSTNTTIRFLAPDGADGCWAGWAEFGQSPRATLLDGAGVARAGFALAGTLLANGGASGANFSLDSVGNLWYSGRVGVATVNVGKITPLGVNTSATGLFPGMDSIPVFDICGDGDGGAFMVTAHRALSTDPFTLRIHRVSSAFAISWTITLKTGMTQADAVALNLRMVKDGAGGVIMVWKDQVATYGSPGGLFPTLYASKINQAGFVEWTVSLYDFPGGSADQFHVVGDGGGGVIVYWCTAQNSVGEIRGQRLDTIGNKLWGDAGANITNVTDLQNNPQCCYVGIVGDEIPIGADAGYHVWSAFDGFEDERGRLGGGGVPVQWLVELPEYDAGDREELKDFNRLGIKVARGSTGVLASVRIGEAATSVPLDVEITESTWGDKTATDLASTLYWGPSTGANPGQPHTWSGEKPVEIAAGIPPGTVGTRASIILSAAIDRAFVLTSISVDYTRLPDRSFKEG